MGASGGGGGRRVGSGCGGLNVKNQREKRKAEGVYGLHASLKPANQLRPSQMVKLQRQKTLEKSINPISIPTSS